MPLRIIAIVAVLLVLASAVWGNRNAAFVRQWLHPEPPPKPIQFDNGTVRKYGSASEPSANQQVQSPPGVMRKCQRGDQVSYTDLICPPGFKEKPVSGPPVTVVAGEAPPRRPAGEPANPGKARATLRDALDLNQDPNLRQRIMDRAVEGQRP